MLRPCCNRRTLRVWASGESGTNSRLKRRSGESSAEIIGERRDTDSCSHDRILGNRIYQQLSGAVAGSQEFTAVAKLYDLHNSGRFDVLVLDTPPSRNALDFLDAPQRLGA